MVREEVFPAIGAAARSAPASVRGSGLGGLTAVVVLQIAIAYVVSRTGWFTPGSDLGYWLGVAGGLMMLALLAYPLRKHVKVLRGLGGIRHWFRLHMVCGIAGPLLILVHSTFHIGSLNAGVALVSMLLVAGSGIVGRFIYVHIHHGLYGEKASLREIQGRLGLDEADVKSKLHLVAPEVEARLLAFEKFALRADVTPFHRAWRFMTLGLRGLSVLRAATRELEVAYRLRAEVRGWEPAKLNRRLTAARALVARYLKNVISVAQFSAYERLFSLWHVLHVPLVYMLAVSAVVHVVAVHMY
jgi:hypothetical protein